MSYKEDMMVQARKCARMRGIEEGETCDDPDDEEDGRISDQCWLCEKLDPYFKSLYN